MPPLGEAPPNSPQPGQFGGGEIPASNAFAASLAPPGEQILNFIVGKKIWNDSRYDIYQICKFTFVHLVLVMQQVWPDWAIFGSTLW